MIVKPAKTVQTSRSDQAGRIVKMPVWRTVKSRPASSSICAPSTTTVRCHVACFGEEIEHKATKVTKQESESPSPKQFSEFPPEPRNLVGKQWLIFSKKNARDLEKMSETLRFMKKLAIIDDEADYASLKTHTFSVRECLGLERILKSIFNCGYRVL